MSEAREYYLLKSLLDNPAFKLLEDLWIYHSADIEDKRDKAAAKGNESAWRYYAGQEKGFKRATTALVMALRDMEKKLNDLTEENKSEKILEELRGMKEGPTL